MKTLIVTFFAFALSSCVFAQDKEDWQKKDMILMKDQKVVVVKNGQKSDLLKDTTLANGTIISVAGLVTSTDGNTVTLKDGEYVNSDGTIGQKARKEDKQDRPKRDSVNIQ